MHALTYHQFLRSLSYYELHRERELIECGMRQSQVRAEIETREREIALAAHVVTLPQVQPINK